MSDIDSLQGEVYEVSEEVLSDLSSEERVQAFVREAAAGNEEFLDKLDETAPQYDYRAQDLDYFTQIQKLKGVSLQARFELQTRYQSIEVAEMNRDKHAALALLNESLCRNSDETLDIDEFGQIEGLPDSDGKSTDGHKSRSGATHLTSKYQALWDDVPQEFLIGEDGRVTEYMENLAATGLMGYPIDISDQSCDELSEVRLPSELHRIEIGLVIALVEFYTRYHGWRLFAEDEIGIPLDELLQITMTEHDDGDAPVLTHGVLAVTEGLCENTLSLNREYLGAIPDLVDYQGEGDEELDLEARAQQFAEGMAESVDFRNIPDEKEHEPNIVFRTT